MKQLSLLIVISMVIVSLLFGCGGGDNGEQKDEPANPIKLIPGKSSMIAHVDIAWILDEMDVEGFYEEIPKEDGDPESFNDVLDMLGIQELEDAYLFGDISEMVTSPELFEGPSGYLGLIVNGVFNQEQLLDAIETQSEEEIVSSDYKGYTVYSDSSGEMAITFLSDGTIVLGTKESVEDVVDVKEGNRSSIKGEVVETYNDLGSGMVKLAMVLPDDLMEEMEEEAGEDIDFGINPFSLFEDMETVGLVVDKKGDSLPVDVRICFSSEESAQNMKGMLGFIVGMMDFEDMDMDEEDTAFLEVLEGMDVNLDKSCVEIGMVISPDIINEMAGSFEEGFMEGFGGFGLGNGEL